MPYTFNFLALGMWLFISIIECIHILRRSLHFFQLHRSRHVRTIFAAKPFSDEDPSAFVKSMLPACHLPFHYSNRKIDLTLPIHIQSMPLQHIPSHNMRLPQYRLLKHLMKPTIPSVVEQSQTTSHGPYII
jgi:hypothetical protein